MDVWNETRNQHYLPQVEQRLNAINPGAPHPKQRIYEFELVNREAFEVRLGSPKGRLISKNLSFTDLFTFDVAPAQKLRMNFENLFQRYEEHAESLTHGLLDKLAKGDSDVSVEVVNLFAAKLLNFARNPFSVAKILNTFGDLANYEPTATVTRDAFERVLNGRKPSQAWLCNKLEISDADYERWLRMLFMLFVESGESDQTMLDSMVKVLFERKDHDIAVLVGMYTHAKCLLSDRTFGQTTDRHDQAGFEFNLCSRAFIRYLFADINGISPSNAPVELTSSYKKMARPIQLYHLVDDIELLRGFNRNAIYQCHSHVYCASKDPIVL